MLSLKQRVQIKAAPPRRPEPLPGIITKCYPTRVERHSSKTVMVYDVKLADGEVTVGWRAEALESLK